VPWVGKPVDKDHRSLDFNVPVEVGGADEATEDFIAWIGRIAGFAGWQ
jgi:hypothetical protein